MKLNLWENYRVIIFNSALMIIFLLFHVVNAQAVTGRMVNQFGEGLADLQLLLYTSDHSYSTVSNSEGRFQFNNITHISDYQLPRGYSVSANYPNPFNPTTRFDINIPKPGRVKISVYDITGQEVMRKIEKLLGAGNSHIDLELNGMPNGFYIARFTIDDNFTIVKKMILLYGSDHLSASNISFNSNLFKTTGMILDSLVVTNLTVGKKAFTNLPYMEDTNLDLGDLVIDLTLLYQCPESVLYGDKNYSTVKIGSQCWLQENLNVGTMLYNEYGMVNNGIIEKYCYNNSPANCEIYGAYYQWDEAMQYATLEGTQGICPDGWHIPTETEFLSLQESVSNSSTALKAVGQGYDAGAGTNSSGFSALLSGYRHYGTGFYSLNDHTYFWSSTVIDTTYSRYRHLTSHNDYIFFGEYSRKAGFSIRCLKDEGAIINNTPPDEPENISPLNNAVNVETRTNLIWTCNDADGDNLTYDIYFGLEDNPPLIISNHSTTSYVLDSLDKATIYYWKITAKDNNGGVTEGAIWKFTTNNTTVLTGEPCPGIENVSYEGKIYNTVQIGEQCWLRKNLDVGTMINGSLDMSDYGVIEKYCQDNLEANCITNGGLYQWEEAMNHNTGERKVGICPEGWHIPSITEWNELEHYVNNDSRKLIAVREMPGATNETNFSALLTGYRVTGGYFHYKGINAYYWTSYGGISDDTAYGVWFPNTSYELSMSDFFRTDGASVRCLKD